MKELMMDRIRKRDLKENVEIPFNWLTILVRERINEIKNKELQNQAAWEIQSVIQKYLVKDKNEQQALLGESSSSAWTSMDEDFSIEYLED